MSTEIKPLTNQKFLRDTLHKFGFYTKKNLGQNFLIDPFSLDAIIDAADISAEDEVIEIGPGPGVLTQALIKTGANITALEIDEEVIPILKYTTQEPSNLTILHQNAVEYRSEISDYILCANIPYYLTSPLLRHYLGGKNRPKTLVFLMQKEVAQRICEKVKNMSVLSLEVLVFGKPSIIKIVEREKFFPAPKVESAILKIEVFKEPLVSKEELVLFWDLVHHCFSEKRKKISNTFAKYREMGSKNAELILNKAGIDGGRRPQTLSIEEWKVLLEVLNNTF